MNAKQLSLLPKPVLSIVPVSPCRDITPTRKTPIDSVIMGGVQYILRRGSGISKTEAKSHGLTQVRISYKDFKRMLYNEHKHKVSSKVIYLPAPAQYRAGQTLHVLGIHETCTVESVFEKWGQTWVQVRHPFGVNTLSIEAINNRKVK